jgi:two-component system LytT family sensor kinase
LIKPFYYLLLYLFIASVFALAIQLLIYNLINPVVQLLPIDIYLTTAIGFLFSALIILLGRTISIVNYFNLYLILILGLSLVCIYFVSEYYSLVALESYLTKQQISYAFFSRCGFWAIQYLSIIISTYSINNETNIHTQLTADNKLKALAKDAELNKLRLQLQPHFLFNSLNSIKALTIINPEQANLMIDKLSNFLRYTIRTNTIELVYLSNEMDHLQQYLAIEEVRFGNRLQVVFNIPEELKKCWLPSLLLQPLIENAIKYSIYQSFENSQIELSATLVNKILQINISNKIELQNMQNTGEGYGLKNIQRRLFLLYGQNDLIKISTENNLFIASIYIPQL